MHPRDLLLDNSDFSPSLSQEEAPAITMSSLAPIPVEPPGDVEPPVDDPSCSSGSGALSTARF